MAILLDGKAIAEKIKAEVLAETSEMKEKPGLAVIIVGENPASRIYVDSKKKDCLACGVRSVEIILQESAGEAVLLEEIQKLNKREDIHGILVQFPLPKGYDPDKAAAAIAPEKDVDAIHLHNAGRVMTGDYGFLPCTPSGVMELLDAYDIEPRGKHCVMVGCSNIVGKPQAMLMLQRDATVSICHSQTVDLAFHTKQADILIVAVGRADLITKEMVKPGAVVVDIGINRTPEGKICGDVAFSQVEPIASHISPVPGGVGPVTRAVLMKNTLLAAKGFYGAKAPTE